MSFGFGGPYHSVMNFVSPQRIEMGFFFNWGWRWLWSWGVRLGCKFWGWFEDYRGRRLMHRTILGRVKGMLGRSNIIIDLTTQDTTNCTFLIGGLLQVYENHLLNFDCCNHCHHHDWWHNHHHHPDWYHGHHHHHHRKVVTSLILRPYFLEPNPLVPFECHIQRHRFCGSCSRFSSPSCS